MADLFLSYAREDRECAALLAHSLSERGWTVWWDRIIRAGQSFDEVIAREHELAKCVIVLWSRHSVKSDWVLTEAAEAKKRKALVPIRIEDVKPPFEFRRLHTVDVFEWRNGFHNAELIDSIDHMVGSTAQRPVPSRPPSGRHAATVEVPRPAPSAPPDLSPPHPQPSTATDAQQQPVKTHLGLAVAATAFSFVGCGLFGIPFGILAIVQAAHVTPKLQAGDLAGAMQSSARAKRYSLISFLVGLATTLAYLIYLFAASNATA